MIGAEPSLVLCYAFDKLVRQNGGKVFGYRNCLLYVGRGGVYPVRTQCMTIVRGRKIHCTEWWG